MPRVCPYCKGTLKDDPLQVHEDHEVWVKDPKYDYVTVVASDGITDVHRVPKKGG